MDLNSADEVPLLKSKDCKRALPCSSSGTSSKVCADDMMPTSRSVLGTPSPWKDCTLRAAEGQIPLQSKAQICTMRRPVSHLLCAPCRNESNPGVDRKAEQTADRCVCVIPGTHPDVLVALLPKTCTCRQQSISARIACLSSLSRMIERNVASLFLHPQTYPGSISEGS